MKRREFIARLGGAMFAMPAIPGAQEAKVPIIGWLRGTTAAGSEHMVAGFRQGLSETGYFEGRNVVIDYRWADNHLDRQFALAADLVRRQVNVIATVGTISAALAAKAATSTIPIVFGAGGDPVAGGLVTNLSRPTGNLTGVSGLATGVDTKRLELLLELLPQATRIAGLVVPVAGAFRTENMRVAGRALGRNIEVIEVPGEETFEGAFAKLVERQTEALFVGVDPMFTANRNKLVGLAARYKIPASYQDREFAVAGGLMCYGANVPETVRQQGVYVGKILGGARVGDLPVLLPTRFEFVINLKTAKALGLTIPPNLLAIADEVIE
jgi:putative tryptophan/tyrosine transport system substrate-binding protein